MTKYSFKTYRRSQRILSIEETFSEGEYFTRAPLTSGKSRLLVNYDLINDGESITNRKGLRVSEVALPFAQYATSPSSPQLVPEITSSLSITQAKDVVEEDNKHYRLVVANKFEHDAVRDETSGLYSAPAELWVIKQDSVSSSYPSLLEYESECKTMYSLPLSYEMPIDYDSTETYNTGDKCLHDDNPYKCLEDGVTGTWDSTKWTTYTYPKSYYKIPTNTKVHGIKIDAIENLARPIGCFAFQDNDYYNFNTDGELIRSVYKPADATLGTTETYIVEALEPKGLTASEAVSCGFNMLSSSPFTFEDRTRSGTIYFDGILPLDNDGNVVTEPVKGTTYTLRCFYQAEVGKEYKIVWKHKAVGTDVTETIDTQTITVISDLPEITVSYSSSVVNDIIYVYAYLKEDGEYSETAEKTQEVSIEFAETKTLNTDSLINYDLSKAKGMCYWKSRLWLYGLAQGPTVLFASEINEPTYFPYPNNIDIFDEPILNCTPFNDTLLVFTRTAVYQLSLNSDGSWTTKTLQSNLDFTDQDANLVQIVKNMVYFKSGEYYYMIVPKSLSLQNELAIAPVSKNIEYFLDEFEENAADLINMLYDYSDSLTLVNHYNFLNYEDVNNVYTFKDSSTTNPLYINLVLLYNTVDRTWRTYVVESQDMFHPFNTDATKVCTMMTPLYAKLNINSAATDISTVGVQFVDTARTSVKDFYVPKNSVFKYTSADGWKTDGGVIETAFKAMHTYLNYQILDTGYRDQSVDYNKRFRELQLKFNNVDMAYIKFSTDFVIDGETRVNHYKYTTEYTANPASSSQGNIYISRTPIENVELPGGTYLGSSTTDTNAWALDNSRFPEIAYWKARLKVSGKGYTPRFRLMSRTEERYELLGYTWVYRLMYAR